LTVQALANHFLNAKAAKMEAGELSERTWEDYRQICDLVVGHFGKNRLVDDLAPADFAQLRGAMVKRWGPVRLGNAIQITRSVFKMAWDDALSDTQTPPPATPPGSATRRAPA
jgi:hypothetical protein